MSAELKVAHAKGAPGNRPFVIGLTGPIASGKSTVAELLRGRGAAVIDADQVYWSLLNPGSSVWDAIVARFGPAVVGPAGQIDRAALGKIVFDDPRALADLERITHPSVVAEIGRQIAAADADVVVLEAIKLVESGLAADVDSLWFVTADPEVRRRRLAHRGLSEDEARARIAASLHVGKGEVPYDVLIDNSGNLSCTARRVAAAWQAVVAPTLPPTHQQSAALSEPKENP